MVYMLFQKPSWKNHKAMLLLIEQCMVANHALKLLQFCTSHFPEEYRSTSWGIAWLAEAPNFCVIHMLMELW